MHSRILLISALILPVLAFPQASGEQKGEASFYIVTPDGACEFGAKSMTLVAALPQALWNGKANCGRHVVVNGPKGSVKVQIVDLCPGCESDKLDLSRDAFARIADLDRGIVPIKWRWADSSDSGASKEEKKADSKGKNDKTKETKDEKKETPPEKNAPKDQESRTTEKCYSN
jgi:hypothetical protein